MKYLRCPVILLLLCLSLFRLEARNDGIHDAHTVRFAYDVNFDMNFDNREFSRSGFSRSMTIFAARLTPSVGISIDSRKGLSHRVMAGVDIMKDFGSSEHDIFREVTLYYQMDRRIGKTDMTVYAGVFPKRVTEGHYSEAFFSDSLRFYDNNQEGLLLKFRRPAAYFELGCDWYGQYSQTIREKFLVFSSGEGKVAPVLSLGYSFYMCHFAGSREVSGVVDNILANPYARFDFGHLIGLQRFSLRLGWLQAMQNDRRNIGRYVFPCGGEFDVEVSNWNVSIRNSMFYGTDMMPYYNMHDAGGYKYGNRLYLGDPFYRVKDDGTGGSGLYDRLDVFWTPYISRFLNIHIGARFHFNGFRYSGCQQMVKLGFNLQELLSRNKR